MKTAAFDPFNLLGLMQGIDNRCLRIMAKDFPAVVSEESLQKLKAQLHQEINPLVVEMMSDLQDLQGYLGPDSIIFGQDARIMGVKEMAEQLPSIFSDVPMTGDEGVDREADKLICIKRVRWSVDIWLQLSGALMRRMDAAMPSTSTLQEGGETFKVPRPSEIDAINSHWQMLRRATMEYFQAKTDLLRACGQDVPRISVDMKLDRNYALNDALGAFWDNESYAPLLLLYSVRDALINVLRLREPDVPFDLRRVMTSQLLHVSHAVGLTLPFPSEVSCNLIAELENHENYCVPLGMAVFYPAMRILELTVRALNGLPPQDEVRQRLLRSITTPQQ